MSCRQETKFSAFGENLVPADNFIRHICGQETQVSCGGVKHRRGNLRSRPLYVADKPPHLGPPIIGRRTQRQLAWPRGPCSCGGNIVAARCAAATLIGGSRLAADSLILTLRVNIRDLPPPTCMPAALIAPGAIS